MHCLLCRNSQTIRVDLVGPAPTFLWHCEDCDFLFKDSSARLTEREERARYDLHQNGGEGHQCFLAPVVQSVLTHCPQGARGIDWGSGPVPVLRGLLEEKGFRMDHYDPFFFPQKPEADETYDFVTLTEVIEHVFEPALLMKELKTSLRPRGKLIVMTEPPPDGSQLAKWGYRRDPTHVAFFRPSTFRRFEELFGLRLIESSARTFILEKAVSGDG
ncbi:MAG TPA: class I SAM-dependent methyltransferase [Pseudobdellovibrionaceae bacterium]|nr:class I SAM-dependent methyltransferase [Pseudobdellovibrionaceae bacterium]